jgi:hypothetical protein
MARRYFDQPHELSALEYLLEGHETMPLERGLFLGETWRLHPSICSYTSELFYEVKLTSHPGLERREEQIMCHDRAVDERRMDPTKRSDIVGAVEGPCLERPNRRFEGTGNLCMTTVKGSRSCQGLLEKPEDLRE